MIMTTKDKYEYGDNKNDENYNYDDDDDNLNDQDNKCDDDDDIFKSLSHFMCVSVYIASHELSISCLNQDNNRLQNVIFFALMHVFQCPLPPVQCITCRIKVSEETSDSILA